MKTKNLIRRLGGFRTSLEVAGFVGGLYLGWTVVGNQAIEYIEILRNHYQSIGEQDSIVNCFYQSPGGTKALCATAGALILGGLGSFLGGVIDVISNINEEETITKMTRDYMNHFVKKRT